MEFEYQFKPVGYSTNEELGDNEIFIAIGNMYGYHIFDKNACKNIYSDNGPENPSGERIGLASLVNVDPDSTLLIYTHYFPDPDAIVSIYLIEYYLRFKQKLNGPEAETLIAFLKNAGDRDSILKELEDAVSGSEAKAEEDLPAEARRIFVQLSMLEKIFSGIRQEDQDVISLGMVLYGKLLLDSYFKKEELVTIEELRRFEKAVFGENGKNHVIDTDKEKLTSALKADLYSVFRADRELYNQQMHDKEVNIEYANLWRAKREGEENRETGHAKIAVWTKNTPSVFARRYAFEDGYSLVMTVKPRKDDRKQISVKALSRTGAEFDISSICPILEIMEQQIEEDKYRAEGRYKRNHAFPRKNPSDPSGPDAPCNVTSDPWYSPDPQTVYSPGIGTCIEPDHIVKILRHITRMVNGSLRKFYFGADNGLNADIFREPQRFVSAIEKEPEKDGSIPLNQWESDIKSDRASLSGYLSEDVKKREALKPEEKDQTFIPAKRYYLAVTRMDSSLISYENRTLRNYLAAVLDNARCDTEGGNLHTLGYDTYLYCDSTSAVFIQAVSKDESVDAAFEAFQNEACSYAEKLVSLLEGYNFIIRKVKDAKSQGDIDRLKKTMNLNEDTANAGSGRYAEAFELMKKAAGFYDCKKKAETLIDDAGRSINNIVLEKLDNAKKYLIPYGAIMALLGTFVSIDKLSIHFPAGWIVIIILSVISVAVISQPGQIMMNDIGRDPQNWPSHVKTFIKTIFSSLKLFFGKVRKHDRKKADSDK